MCYKILEEKGLLTEDINGVLVLKKDFAFFVLKPYDSNKSSYFMVKLVKSAHTHRNTLQFIQATVYNCNLSFKTDIFKD